MVRYIDIRDISQNIIPSRDVADNVYILGLSVGVREVRLGHGALLPGVDRQLDGSELPQEDPPQEPSQLVTYCNIVLCRRLVYDMRENRRAFDHGVYA